MNKMKRTVILGTGHYVPPKVVTNFDLEKMMDTSNEWIVQRTGIRERHFVEPGIGSSDLAYEASIRAIEDAGIDKSEIDFIILATLSPDHYFPGVGVILQAKLGLAGIGALDVRNQCTGFIYALSVADQYIKTGMYKRILVVGAEVQSSNLNFSTEGRDMAVLFGDGAGAVIVGPNEEDNDRGILSTHLFADGRFLKDLWMEKPSPKDNPVFSNKMIEEKRYFPRMDGRSVFKNATVRMPEAVKIALKHNNLTIDDVDLIIPHQANYRITELVARSLGVSMDKVMSNIDKYGNTTAASIPIALDEAIKSGRLKKNDIVVLTAFGSGYTWGSAVIKM
ncbi:ketoacyl-ACP synthase III [SCandidatus Aminicenantes bacterium Aminicenantia_JdfR_composite]|jgi:3-oxoacyl-[acyl-carrier-protein] synthase-3|nr:ketoacyl-ACP synthase III [SCandidatus Aminicenantes bacterium Aminicenantia_JdfR_composite]MCP2605560.1 ketoacyl-ACP synthase III [Candidatus Aminicenantes bacterium AC-335-O07]